MANIAKNNTPVKSYLAKTGALVAIAPSIRCGYFSLSHADRAPEISETN